MQPRAAVAALVIALAASASPLTAQSGARVDPPAYRWLDTDRTTGFPLGYPMRQVVRYQEVHDGLRDNPTTVTGIAFRRGPLDVAAVPAFDADVSMRLSTAATTATTISNRFASNEGIDAVQALAARRVSFPATQGPTTGLAPFDFVIPVDTPFMFGGNGSLCVEFLVTAHTSTDPIRFALAAENAELRTATIEPACSSFELHTTADSTAIRHATTGAPPSSPVFVAFGLSTDSLAGIQLPLDLTPFGGAGCEWAIDIVATAGGNADYLGAFAVELLLTDIDPGTLWFAQALTLPVSRNQTPPARAVLSSNVDLALNGTGRSAGRVWSEDPNSTTGQRQPVFGLVLEIRE